MPTHATEQPGVGEAAKHVADHASTIAKLELELATLELKRKVAALGLGIGLLAGGTVLGLFALAFGLAAVAAALATFLSTWLALLLVTAFLLLGAGLLAVLGLGGIRKGTPPVPEQAIREAKLTTDALRSNGTH